MEDSRLDAVARLAAKLASRRTMVQGVGIVGIGATLGALAPDLADVDAKKNKKKRRRKKRRKKRNQQQENPPPQGAAFPFPRSLTYGGSSIKPNQVSQEQLNTDVIAAYERWKKNYLVDEGGGVYRVAFGKSGGNYAATVSEGLGFGMMIVATMAGYEAQAQSIVDGLWQFRLAHPSKIDSRLMDWKVPDGGGNDSAFDGDADIAYGLLLAEGQWGNGGAVNYETAFNDTAAGILASTIGPQSRLPMLGDWVNPNGSPQNQNTPRTSDFMPGHFRAFGRASGNAVWNDVIAACQSVVTSLQANYSPVTGLLPDFATGGVQNPVPAYPGFLEGQNDGNYNYNAGRDPWRLATDALLNGNAASAAQAGKIANWVNTATGGNPQSIAAGYTLDGTPLANYFTTFFAAPIGVAAMTDPALQAWLNAIYAAVQGVSEDYYEDTVTLLCLLVMTGNFWDPTS